MQGNCYSCSCVVRRKACKVCLRALVFEAAQPKPFSTALPTRSSSFSGTEDKVVLGKEAWLFMYSQISEDPGVLHGSVQSKGAVCAWDVLAGNGEQPLPGCSLPTPAPSLSVCFSKRGWVKCFPSSLIGVLVPFSSSLLAAGETESSEIPFWVCISFCTFSVLNI